MLNTLPNFKTKIKPAGNGKKFSIGIRNLSDWLYKQKRPLNLFCLQLSYTLKKHKWHILL